MIIIPIVTRKIKKSVTYRDLGGKTIIIDRELTRDDVLTTENWACWNFIDRRPDVRNAFVHKRYFYGHAEDNMGYVVCEDELESEVPQVKDHANGV